LSCKTCKHVRKYYKVSLSMLTLLSSIENIKVFSNSNSSSIRAI
jgi:hypothetical protein